VRGSLSCTKPSGVGYRLGDGEALNREHPDTFLIPPRDERERLTPGDLVKLSSEGIARLTWARPAARGGTLTRVGGGPGCR